MPAARISASSYSNTAPLVWSFLYGENHGKVEMVLDNAPARSAELLAADRVDAALVPVVAYQTLDDVRLIDDVCVGARERVRSVCLITRGDDLADSRTVALDTSSRTSAALTKILFKEFIGSEPRWIESAPEIDAMLASSDAALMIGDPALRLSSIADARYRTFDLAELWKEYTGFGFVFAMWMTGREKCTIDFAAVRDEGLAHADDIAANYAPHIGLKMADMKVYLTENISYSLDDSMRSGMELYFRLAKKHGLIPANKPIAFV